MTPGWEKNRRIRFYGEHGAPVVVLHGGPGAFGSAARLAQGLSGVFRVTEPWQRRCGELPLTVAVHVSDLHGLIQSRFDGGKPALVGSSWGAMLALAYAAEHADTLSAVVLSGCGTFDPASRAEGVRRRRQRIAEYIAAHPEHQDDLKLDIGAQIMKWHMMTDTYAPISDEAPVPDEPFDLQGHTETWQDMLRCQEEKRYPQTFAAITVPVLMLHGAEDPHPGAMIRDTLRKYIPHLEYHEFPQCGHEPESERYARDDYFAVMSTWLARRFVEENAGNPV